MDRDEEPRGALFSEEFLDSLPTDPWAAIDAMVRALLGFDEGLNTQNKIACYRLYADSYAAIEAMCNANSIALGATPKFTGSDDDKIQSIVRWARDLGNRATDQIRKQEAEDALSTARDKYAARFGLVFSYEFSDGDLKQIQELLNELRDQITASDLFEAKHKQRILEKLEALQRELHKRMSSLDKFWGLFAEAGILLGKFGKDAKPFFDLIREMTRIAALTQALTEGLPSGMSFPRLSSDGKDPDIQNDGS